MSKSELVRKAVQSGSPRPDINAVKKTKAEIDAAINTLGEEMRSNGFAFVFSYATPERELIYTLSCGHDFDIVGMCEFVKDTVATSRRERIAELAKE